MKVGPTKQTTDLNRRAMESQTLLPQKLSNNDEIESESSVEEQWSDGSSYSSYFSDSDSTIPDWEPYVDDFTGELLYIECHPFLTQNNKESNTKQHKEAFSKTQLRRSTRGKFLRLIRRRDSKRRSKKCHKVKPVDVNESTSKVKFQDFQEGEEKEVMLEIDAENRHNLSCDVSLSESLLGLIVSTLSDGNRVMIAGFSYDSKAKNERNIKIGDWLKSINNIEVNVQNLDDILQKFINRDDVLLKLQRVAGVDVTKEPPFHELNNESNFVRELLNLKSDNEQLLMQILCKHSVGIVYIDTDKLNESNRENEDVVYCFPRPVEKNILCLSRGMYITLNHLLDNITKSKPKTTSIKHKDQIAHIVYTSFQNNLLLFMLPQSKASLSEIVLINDELIRLLTFSYETVHQSFTLNKFASQMDHFFFRFFARVLSGSWATAQQFVELQSLSTKRPQNVVYQFEDVMPAAQALILPDEARMQVDDALFELEASDYRDWNEEPLDCQRLFTILGSAVYHSGCLLASHFVHEDLVQVHGFCKQQGLFHLSKSEPVKSLILWKEVYPFSCNESQTKVPDGKRYLLIVGSGKDLLAVLMEAGGCTEPPEENMGPDAFYVEEAQATLAHLQELGVGELSDYFLSMNPGPQVAAISPKLSTGKGDFISLNFSNKANLGAAKDSNSPKKNEVISILKKGSSDTNANLAAQSSSNLPTAEEAFEVRSESSESYSELSEDSRRNLRSERCNSESETDEFEGSQVSVGSFDVSEIRQNLLSEAEDSRPLQLTAGNQNYLHHFVQLDLTEGILLCPPECKAKTQTYDYVINAFRKYCQKIHGLFRNTVRFKELPAQEMGKSVMNKSLIAIKEHGICFSCPYLEDKDKKEGEVSYWVVGRLFYIPHPREIYVCYQDGVPQNLIEIAFKINLGKVN